MNRSRHRNTQGFTLLELLMVVIIIGILSSIALPQYLRATKKARRGEALSTLAQMRSAVLRFQAENSACPGAIDAVGMDVTFPAGVLTGATGSWVYSTDGSCALTATGNTTAIPATCTVIMDKDGAISGTLNAQGDDC